MPSIHPFLESLRSLYRHHREWSKEKQDQFLWEHLPSKESPLSTVALLWGLFLELPHTTEALLQSRAFSCHQSAFQLLQGVEEHAELQTWSHSDRKWLTDTTFSLSNLMDYFEDSSLFYLALTHGQLKAIPLFATYQAETSDPNWLDGEKWNAPLSLAFGFVIKKENRSPKEEVFLALDALESLGANFQQVSEKGITFLSYAIKKEAWEVLQWVQATHPTWLQTTFLASQDHLVFKKEIEGFTESASPYNLLPSSNAEPSPLELAFFTYVYNHSQDQSRALKGLQIIALENEEPTSLMTKMRETMPGLESVFALFDQKKLNHTLPEASSIIKPMRL